MDCFIVVQYRPFDLTNFPRAYFTILLIINMRQWHKLQGIKMIHTWLF